MTPLTTLAAMAAPLGPLRNYLTIAHHVRGRIRLRLAPSGIKLLSGDLIAKLETLASGAPGIQNVRINAAALSVVIEYSPEMISSDTWEKLIQASDTEFARLINPNLSATSTIA